MVAALSKSDRTRSFIIEASSAIFNEKGYAGTSMNDLTEATGLTKGSIYGNFQSKEDVALAVFDYNFQKVTNVIQREVDRAETYYDKLMVYAHVYHRFSESEFPKGGCPVLNTAIEADDTKERLKAKAANALRSWHKNISSLLSEGTARGEFKEVINYMQLASSIIALIEGGMMITKVTDSDDYLRQATKTIEILLQQIKI